MRNYKIDTEYKNSLIGWNDKIPSNWTEKKAKYIFKSKKVINKKLQSTNRLALTLKGVVNRSMTDSLGLSPNDFKTYQLFEKNDLVFKLIDLENINTSRVGIVHEDGIMSSAYIRTTLIDKNTSPKYYYYLYYDWYKKNIFNSIGSGVRSTLTSKDLLELEVSIPPLPEQTAIANFLDKKTAQIKQFITLKEKTIVLLKERKTAIINQAVTKGLNPIVKMKDSGIEWLGEIPEHWEVKKLKYLSKVISKGTTPSTEGRGMTDSGIRYLKAENIFESEVKNIPQFFIDTRTHQILKRSQLKALDILFVIAGATIGKTAILREEMLPANTNQAVSFIRLYSKEHPNFVHLWLQSGYINEQIWLKAVQSAQPNLSMEDLGNFSIPYPKIDEQIKIQQFIENKLTKLDQSISQAEKEIALMKEYQQSLISEAVTGKIDVRSSSASDHSHLANQKHINGN